MQMGLVDAQETSIIVDLFLEKLQLTFVSLQGNIDRQSSMKPSSDTASLGSTSAAKSVSSLNNS